MPDIAADLQLACSDLLPQTGIEEFQSLRPDPIPSRARARARGPGSTRAEEAHADAAPGAAVGRPDRCYSAALEKGTEQSQALGPDPIPARACARARGAG